MKRITLLVCLILVLLLAGSTISYARPDRSFSDMTTDYWAAKQILSLANYGIIGGNPDGTFRPAQSLTRSELAKLLTTAFMLKQSSPSLDYTDLNSTHWAAGFVAQTVGEGLMNGFPDATFRPDAPTTRAQMAKIIVQIRGYSTASISTKTFGDVTTGHWCYPYIETAAKNYLISGYPDGTFKPNAQITRAEAAALIYRTLSEKDYLLHSSTVNGITYERYRRFKEAGPVNINILRIPKSAPVSIDIGLAKDRVTGLETLSHLAGRKGAVAGINADYFSFDGSGCSGILVDGQIISSPMNRSYFGMLPDKSFFVDMAKLDARVTAANEREGIISWVNKPRNSIKSQDTLIAYTPFYGPSTLTNDTGTEVVVRLEGTVTPNSEIGGTVIDVKYDAGNSPIPPDGIVLSGVGSGKTYLTANMKLGDTVKVKFNLGPSWQDGASAIGGGPRIMRNGQVGVENEAFQREQVAGRGPRTGIGIDAAGNLIIEVVDGRMDFFSIGTSLTELATDLKNKGAIDAMSFDSGGSSALYFNGAIHNFPSDGQERAISNALLFSPN